MKKIYIANPLGFSEASQDFCYERLLPLVRESGFEVLDPRDTGIKISGPENGKKVWERFAAVR